MPLFGAIDPMALNTHSGHRRRFARDILAFGIDEVLNSYLPEQVGNNSGAALLPVAAIGPRNSTRMIAQSGTFTIMHNQRIAVEASCACCAEGQTAHQITYSRI